MAGTLKPVRFKLSWQTYRVGDVITPPGVLRDWLIRNGYCELLPEKPGRVRNAANVVKEAAGGLFVR